SGANIHSGVAYKGTIVLGTVYQDVHSIGKDLAKTLFENYGYRTIDLGVMVPLEGFIDAAKEYDADAVGMSALLVQTSNHMITVSNMMLEQGLEDTPVLIGGAPVNDRHAAYVAMAGGDDTSEIRSNVFYCATAMDGVNVMNALRSGEDPTPLLEKNRRKLLRNLERAEAKTREREEQLSSLPRRVITFEGQKAPEAPWACGNKVSVPLNDFAASIDLKTLFALNWKFGGTAAREKRGETADKLHALFEEWIEKADREGWIQPQGVWGLYPCRSDDDEVVVYDPEDLERELCRFDFTVVVGGERKDTVCAAQYFRPKESGVVDALGVQIATAGAQVDAQLMAFKEQGDSESSLYLQGLSDRVAEDMADVLHAKLREAMGLAGSDTGARWSPGYPAMTNTDNNRRILSLLDGTSTVGVHITDAGEFSPTGTTAAVVCFHPDARYT
ncbi:MAG: 5-methyltetrahydrofolate--homocysteine methyltransferase, partial [bacterium]|nr:5-methyltetrahydrofolate--homocysteine methyltransferase [bacterium]